MPDLIIKEKCPSAPYKMLRKYIKLLVSSQVTSLPGSDSGGSRLHLN